MPQKTTLDRTVIAAFRIFAGQRDQADRARILAVIAAGLAIAVALQTSPLPQDNDAAALIDVHAVTVPDFSASDDVNVNYDRTIYRSFVATWIAEVQRRENGGWFQFCSGQGTNRYRIDARLPAGGVPLDWYIGKKCQLPPGQYRLVTTYQIHRGDSRPALIYHAPDSNTFEVFPET